MKNNNSSSLRLTIDKQAIAENYNLLCQASNPAICGAAVKANAYGCGLETVVPILEKQGCEHYFVADALEGKNVRKIAPNAKIYVLSGFWPDCAELFATHNLQPILNSTHQINAWQAAQINQPFTLHIDTGMNRLGVRFDTAVELINNLPSRPDMIMSHFACADNPDHPTNATQLARFNAIKAACPDIKASMANSAATLSNPAAHFDLTRPGIALYGANPINNTTNPMQNVATVETRILDIKSVKAGETVSYGATFTADKDMIMCTCGIGYADGYHRAGSGQGVPNRELNETAHAFFKGYKLKPIGRITMDITMFDISHIPNGAINIGDWVEILGKNISLDQLADASGTISYEILTSFGRLRHG